MSSRPALALAFALLWVASCKKSVGEVRTVDVAGDAQGTPAAPASVSITLKAGELHLTPGGAHTLGGSARSNVKDLDPKLVAAGDKVTLTQGAPELEASAWGPDLVADWRLTLGPTPLSLTFDAGAAKADLELGGLAIKSLHGKTGAGAITVGFAQANPLAADDIDLDTGSGTVTLTNVGAFGASKIHVHAGMGAITIDLGNKVDRDVALNVEATAGAVTIKLADGVTARAQATTSAGAVSATGWTKDGDAFVLGAPTPTPRVSIVAKSGAGAITLSK